MKKLEKITILMPLLKSTDLMLYRIFALSLWRQKNIFLKAKFNKELKKKLLKIKESSFKDFLHIEGKFFKDFLHIKGKFNSKFLVQMLI